MDPNETLRQLRELILTNGDCGGPDDMDCPNLPIMGEILELFQALDEWLKKGGFLPKEWDVGKRSGWLRDEWSQIEKQLGDET